MFVVQNLVFLVTTCVHVAHQKVIQLLCAMYAYLNTLNTFRNVCILLSFRSRSAVLEAGSVCAAQAALLRARLGDHWGPVRTVLGNDRYVGMEQVFDVTTWFMHVICVRDISIAYLFSLSTR